MNGSVTSSTFSSEESLKNHEHNIWNPMLASLCHFEVGVVMEALLDEVDMGRIALACHFSLDVLCDKTSSLPVVNDHVSVRNWPPLLPQHVETESDGPYWGCPGRRTWTAEGKGGVQLATSSMDQELMIARVPGVWPPLWNCRYCQPSVDGSPDSVHPCSTSHMHLYLLVVNTCITWPLWMWYVRMLAGKFAVFDGLAQAISALGKSCFVCSTLSAHLAMPQYTRDYGKSSSWYAERWAPHANTYSGWSKRASRGFYNHRWNEDASQGSPWGTPPETWDDAEVELCG